MMFEWDWVVSETVVERELRVHYITQIILPNLKEHLGIDAISTSKYHAIS